MNSRAPAPILAVAMLLSACGPVPSPGSSTPLSPPTIARTRTPTAIPSPTSTPPPTLHPTSTPIALDAALLEPISVSNAHRIERLASFGEHSPLRTYEGWVAASLGGDVVVFPSTSGFYALHLDTLSLAYEVETPDYIWAVAASPDGSYVFTALQGGGITAWDATTGRKAFGISSGALLGKASHLQVSTDSRYLLVDTYDATYLWDIRSRSLAHTYPGNHTWASALSPDGTRVALASGYAVSVDILDATTGEVVHHVTGAQQGPVRALDISPDNNLLAASLSGNPRVVVFDLATNKAIKEIPCYSTPNTVEFSPDGKSLVVGADAVYVWRVGEEGKVPRLHPAGLETAGDPGTSAHYSNRGDRIVSVSNQHVATWDASSLALLNLSHWNAIWPEAMQFAHDSTLAIVTSGRIYSAHPLANRPSLTLDAYVGTTSNLAIAEDAPRAAFISNGYLTVLDLDTLQVLMRQPDTYSDGITISSDGSLVALLRRPKYTAQPTSYTGLHVWDLTQRERITDLRATDWAGRAIAFIPGKPQLLSIETTWEGDLLAVRDIQGRQLRRVGHIPHAESVYSIVVDPIRGAHALLVATAVGTGAGALYIFDAPSASISQLHLALNGTQVSPYAISPDRTLALVPNPAVDRVSLLAIRSAEEVSRLPEERGVFKATFSSDGRLLATADIWGGISLWGVRAPPAMTPPTTTATPPSGVVYDSFGESRYDGIYNPDLWILRDPAVGTASQENGIMMLRKARVAGDLLFDALGTWAYQGGYYVQADIRLDEARHDGVIRLAVGGDIGPSQAYWAECALNPDAYFSCLYKSEARGVTIDSYESPGKELQYDTWYTLRIEIDPQHQLIRYFLDGELIGSNMPKDHDVMLGSPMHFFLSVLAGPAAARADNVMAGPAEW